MRQYGDMRSPGRPRPAAPEGTTEPADDPAEPAGDDTPVDPSPGPAAPGSPPPGAERLLG
jgi:hypothetical protein